MTTTVAEASDLIETAAGKGLKLVASPGEMLRPHNQRIKELLAGGALGRLAWAACGAAFGTYHEKEAVRQGEDPLSNIDPSWYYRKPGGGPLYDMTVYALHGLTGILGPARRVTALSGVRVPEREFRGRMVPCDADDNTLMVLDFGDTLFAFVYGTAAGRVTEGFMPSFFGTEGQIVGLKHNGEPLDYPGRELAEGGGGASRQWLLPHVVGEHRGHRGAARLRGHHAAGRLGAGGDADDRHGRARPARDRHHRVRLPGGGDGPDADPAHHVLVPLVPPGLALALPRSRGQAARSASARSVATQKSWSAPDSWQHLSRSTG